VCTAQVRKLTVDGQHQRTSARCCIVLASVCQRRVRRDDHSGCAGAVERRRGFCHDLLRPENPACGRPTNRDRGGREWTGGNLDRPSKSSRVAVRSRWVGAPLAPRTRPPRRPRTRTQPRHAARRHCLVGHRRRGGRAGRERPQTSARGRLCRHPQTCARRDSNRVQHRWRQQRRGRVCAACVCRRRCRADGKAHGQPHATAQRASVESAKRAAQLGSNISSDRGALAPAQRASVKQAKCHAQLGSNVAPDRGALAPAQCASVKQAKCHAQRSSNRAPDEQAKRCADDVAECAPFIKPDTATHRQPV